MRIGLITGGGDCPGLNAAIRAVVKHGLSEYGHTIIGFKNGWQGVIDGDIYELGREQIRGVLDRGGTVLGTARCHPHSVEGGLEAVTSTLAAERIDALICIGGDGTLHAASKVAETGINVIGIPKTIDNDVVGTDTSIGFHTAVNIATEAIDRIHTTAESHNRVMVVEVMGRSVGWIATYAGIAGGAERILVPEAPFDMDELVRFLKHRHRAHANFSILVVAEGAAPAVGSSFEYEVELGRFGEIVAGSASAKVAAAIQERTGFDTRVTVLGHVQRGGTPTPFDRVLGSRFGIAAVEALQHGQSDVMTCLNGEHVGLIPISEIAGQVKRVPPELLQVANSLA